MAQAAGREADGFGDFIGDANIGRVEVHVVSNQEFARAYDRDSGSGVKLWFANIGLTIVIALQVFAEAFELAAAHVFEIYAIRACCSGFVEKYRDAIAFPYFVADTTGEGYAIFE